MRLLHQLPDSGSHSFCIRFDFYVTTVNALLYLQVLKIPLLFILTLHGHQVDRPGHPVVLSWSIVWLRLDADSLFPPSEYKQNT